MHDILPTNYFLATLFQINAGTEEYISRKIINLAK